MLSEDLIVRRRRVLRGLRQYYDLPFHPIRGEGCWLYDVEGRKVLDAYNNVPHVGHCHPHVVEAICRQVRELNTNTRYLFEPIVEYAEKLVATMPDGLDACIFTCTGSEANDLAWRLASNFSGNTGVITSENAYHGNTTFLDQIDGSSTKARRENPNWWIRVPAPPARQSGDAREDKVAAVAYAGQCASAVAELIGRGHPPAAFYFESLFCTDGIRVPRPGFMGEAISKVREVGGLIIVDEVQAGLARCGTDWWAFQNLGVEPDIVVMGKPMGNGLPVGVVVARHEIVDAFYARDRYFNTFAGNPVCCAAGIAVLEVIEREQLKLNALRIGTLLKRKIEGLMERHPNIGGVRGRGLLLGIELVIDQSTMTPASRQARWVINEMCRRGVLVGLTGPDRNARNILKVRPPLVFDEHAVDVFMTTLDAVLADLPSRLE